jgi:hypothetical protein
VLSSLLRAIGFAADHPKKHVPFRSPQFRIVPLRGSLEKFSYEKILRDFSIRVATPS